jgi:hypothetical protein
MTNLTFRKIQNMSIFSTLKTYSIRSTVLAMFCILTAHFIVESCLSHECKCNDSLYHLFQLKHSVEK